MAGTKAKKSKVKKSAPKGKKAAGSRRRNAVTKTPSRAKVATTEPAPSPKDVVVPAVVGTTTTAVATIRRLTRGATRGKDGVVGKKVVVYAEDDDNTEATLSSLDESEGNDSDFEQQAPKKSKQTTVVVPKKKALRGTKASNKAKGGTDGAKIALKRAGKMANETFVTESQFKISDSAAPLSYDEQGQEQDGFYPISPKTDDWRAAAFLDY